MFTYLSAHKWPRLAVQQKLVQSLHTQPTQAAIVVTEYNTIARYYWHINTAFVVPAEAEHMVFGAERLSVEKTQSPIFVTGFRSVYSNNVTIVTI